MKNMRKRLRIATTPLVAIMAFIAGITFSPAVDVFAEILEPEPRVIISKSYAMNDVTPCGGNVDAYLEELEAERQEELRIQEEQNRLAEIERMKHDPNTDIHSLIQIVADEIGLDWRVLEGIVYAESTFNPECGRGSHYVGLCQVSRTNYSNLKSVLELSDNYHDRYSNLKCGAYIYQCLLIKYQDYHKALVCYNMGEGGAKGIRESGYSRKVINYARSLGFDR